MANKRKFYVVWEGRNPGIYDNWDDAKDQIDGFKGARYKSFTSLTDATEAFRSGADSVAEGIANLLLHLDAINAGTAPEGSVAPAMEPEAPEMPWKDIPEVVGDAIATDASCLGNPGKMEYRGIDLATGKEIFRMGVFDDSTNNIGEYLALVHALALCKKLGVNRTIYTDSKTALSWLRRRGSRSQLRRTPKNERSFQLLERADAWVKANSWATPVVKWNTEEWGEIPADFGRK